MPTGDLASPTGDSASSPGGEQGATVSSRRPNAEQRRAVVAPLSEDAFRIQFTGRRAFRDKLRRAQDLLRHRFRKGDVGAILELALDALIERVEKERFAKMTALGRWADPKELVAPALVLASDAGSYITGTTLVVDGGFLAR